MAPHEVDDRILLIPRNDGFVLSVKGRLYLVPQTSVQMMHLGIKCLQAGLEMQKIEESKKDEH
tara:strand:- start:103 stop:291 length:189 start_codon:yes stop_codon:yes gene_type:complete